MIHTSKQLKDKVRDLSKGDSQLIKEDPGPKEIDLF